MTVSSLPSTPTEANALYKKAGKVLGTPKKSKINEFRLELNKLHLEDTTNVTNKELAT